MVSIGNGVYIREDDALCVFPSNLLTREQVNNAINVCRGVMRSAVLLRGGTILIAEMRSKTILERLSSDKR